MKLSIEVDNIRCGGCANTITKKLMALEGVEAVDVQIEDQIVTIESPDEANRDKAAALLASLGYPEKGSVEGMAALKGKARSVVSCAVGKIS